MNAERSKYIICAYTFKLVIENRYMSGNVFIPTNEHGLNRNYISHGMNKYIPDAIDCLQLFVFLYNTYALLNAVFLIGITKPKRRLYHDNHRYRRCRIYRK